MSMNWGATAEPDQRGRPWGRGRGLCGWNGAEIAIMVLGFIVFWPIGLAMIAFKIWQRRSGYQGDLGNFARETWSAAKSGDWKSTPYARSACSFTGPRGGWGGWKASSAWTGGNAWGARSTGNAAFDEWRDKELARLEEERRKLEAAEREFAEYADNLRRARDREEFDRFMSEKRGFGEHSPPQT